MRRSKQPVGTHDREQWIKNRVEPAARPRRQVTFTFTDASTEYRIRHRLPHPPEGWAVISQDKAGQLYRDETTARADRHYLYLKSSAAALTVVLELF